MITIIHESTQRARRDYYCDACEILFNYMIHGFTFSEYRILVKAKRNSYKILKGETYIRQFNTDGEDTWTYRAIPEIHQICIKHELYDNF